MDILTFNKTSVIIIKMEILYTIKLLYDKLNY